MNEVRVFDYYIKIQQTIKGEVAIVYLDSMNSGLTADYSQVAHDLKTFIDEHKWLGVTLKPQDVLDLSKYQQVNQCCGLAAASNNASLVQFYYDNATEYTNIGMLSGGMQLSHVKLKILDCSQINKVISSAISVNSLQIS